MLTSNQEHILSHNSLSHWSHSDLGMTSFYKTTLEPTTRIRVKSQKLRTSSEQEKTRTTDTSCATITGRRDGDRNNKGRGMGSENGAYLSMVSCFFVSRSCFKHFCSFQARFLSKKISIYIYIYLFKMLLTWVQVGHNTCHVQSHRM